MFRVYLFNDFAPNTPIAVGWVYGGRSSSEAIKEAGFQLIFSYYTPEQVKGYRYEIFENGGRRRKISGRFK